MDHGVLGKQLVSLYKANDSETLKALLQKSLGEFRPQTLAQLHVLMPTVDGKMRLKILEMLIEDGQPDLVPFFIKTIRMEKNSLYAKSMLLVYGNFEDEAAVSALVEIENNLTSDLKSTFQRIIARFRARFREYFYMTEFDSGIQKRMKFASNLMIKEPHPKYIPFLNNHLNSSVLTLKFESIRVLEEIGDETSLEALFKLLETSLKQKNGETAFKKVLASIDRENMDGAKLLEDLAAGMNFTLDTLKSTYARAKRGTVKPFVDSVSEAFHFQSESLERVLGNFLKMFVLGSPITASDYRRMDEELAEYDKQLLKTLGSALNGMGSIAVRHPTSDLVARVDQLLPAAFPNREYQMIQLLRGFRNEESFQKILGYLSSASEPVILLEGLDALEAYESDALPDIVRKLALQNKRADLRQKAVGVVGKWGHGHLIMEALLAHGDSAVKNDGVALIKNFKPPGGQKLLVSLLSLKTPGNLLNRALEALIAYPGDETGKLVLPFLSEKAPYETRQSAMSALVNAGGDHRFDLYFQLLKGADEQRSNDLISTLLSFLKKIKPCVWEQALIERAPLWPGLLNHENSKYRDQFLILLESCSWELENHKPWIKNLEKALNEDISRGGLEQKRLNQLFSDLKEMQERAIKCGRAQKVLHEILTTFKKGEVYDQVKAMRRLSMAYKPEMLEGDGSDVDEINTMICTVLDDSNSSEELLRLTVSAVSRIDHPHLVKRVEKFVGHQNGALAQLSREIVLRHAEKPEGKIQSIFIIDDSKLMTKQLTVLLLKAGYRVIAENHVKEGLMALSRDGFDLMILDLNMPEMHGAQFLQTARNAEMAPDHILVMSSTRDREELGAIVQQGVDGLFLKPFPLKDILEKIQALEAV